MDKKVTLIYMVEPKNSARCRLESNMAWKSPFKILNKQICETNRTCQKSHGTQTSPFRFSPKTNYKQELQDLKDAYQNVLAKVEQLETEFQKSGTKRGGETNIVTISHVESFVKSCFFNPVNILKTVIVVVFSFFNAKFQNS